MKQQASVESIIAAVNTSAEAQLALTRLAAAGVPRHSITVSSSEPLHFHPAAPESSARSHIGTLAAVGGIVGAALAIILTVWTSRQVNLMTGGMPIVSPWALAVIVFEMTALGAILTCVGRMIFEARLARAHQLKGYGEPVAEGKVVLSLEITNPAHREIAEQVFGQSIIKSN